MAPHPIHSSASATERVWPHQLVAGCLAVLRQAMIHYMGIEDPNASLIKALLLHGAHDIGKGKYQGKEIGPAPNYIQGYGLVDMATTLLPVLSPSDDSHPRDASGIWESSVQIETKGDEIVIEPSMTSFRVPKQTVHADGQVPNTVIVTMVYTDRPGEELQTLLNLTITTMDA